MSGTVRVQADTAILDLQPGDMIQAYCWLDKFEPPTNPGQFDTAAYLARTNVFVSASVKSRDSIEIMKVHQGGLFAEVKNMVRQKAYTALLTGISPDQQSCAMLEALLLGRRTNISADVNLAFQKTGLAHYISLSGMHLVILIGSIWWLCRKAGLNQRTIAFVCIVALTLFLLVVPPRAPTIRAAIMVYVYCISF